MTESIEFMDIVTSSEIKESEPSSLEILMDESSSDIESVASSLYESI